MVSFPEGARCASSFRERRNLKKEGVLISFLEFLSGNHLKPREGQHEI
jgi:hypothetical protein